MQSGGFGQGLGGEPLGSIVADACRYAEPDERKACEDSAALIDILRNPNGIALAICGIAVGVLVLVRLLWLP